jgi:hypothetical protein
MRDGSEIEALLDSLETLADEAEGKRKKWRDVWSEIKSIGQAFKESRFPTVQDRQAAWNRFQSIIARANRGRTRIFHRAIGLGIVSQGRGGGRRAGLVLEGGALDKPVKGLTPGASRVIPEMEGAFLRGSSLSADLSFPSAFGHL